MFKNFDAAPTQLFFFSKKAKGFGQFFLMTSSHLNWYKTEWEN
jgi:hypothetical protein